MSNAVYIPAWGKYLLWQNGLPVLATRQQLEECCCEEGQGPCCRLRAVWDLIFCTPCPESGQTTYCPGGVANAPYWGIVRLSKVSCSCDVAATDVSGMSPACGPVVTYGAPAEKIDGECPDYGAMELPPEPPAPADLWACIGVKAAEFSVTQPANPPGRILDIATTVANPYACGALVVRSLSVDDWLVLDGNYDTRSGGAHSFPVGKVLMCNAPGGTQVVIQAADNAAYGVSVGASGVLYWVPCTGAACPCPCEKASYTVTIIRGAPCNDSDTRTLYRVPSIVVPGATNCSWRDAEGYWSLTFYPGSGWMFSNTSPVVSLGGTGECPPTGTWGFWDGDCESTVTIS